MPKEVRTEIRAALREVGQKVKEDADAKTSRRLKSPKSGHGYRVVVRARGVNVEQSLRKTTGLRGDWGSSQMRFSLIPALDENAPETAKAMEEAMEQITELFTLLARWQGTGLIPTP